MEGFGRRGQLPMAGYWQWGWVKGGSNVPRLFFGVQAPGAGSGGLRDKSDSGSSCQGKYLTGKMLVSSWVFL